ncbi:hypothetical protein H4F99_09420 [Lysobacter sp. SG-8]|uniref:Uncharacterized protein n=2 Tax=Marilutibacter penaei TaxID=2759900 RepID=A0A7W3U4D4_9GAMM|nr:hypothetical protein [Lysobacter penaei]
MAILAVVLVPLFLLIPMLAKYAHMRQVAQQATRAAAWEATAVDAYDWDSSLKSSAWRSRQRNLLVDRHFALAETRILSTPEQAQQDAGVPAAMMNTFSDQPLLKRNGISLEPFGNDAGGPLSGFLEGAGGLLDSLPGSSVPPNSDGLVTARMVVTPENLKASDGSAATFVAPFDSLDLSIESRHVLLADTWGASGSGLIDAGSRNSRRVKDQLAGPLVPSSWLSGVTDVLEKIEFMEKVPLVGVPFRIRPGYMEPDIVPRDRLQEYQQ